MTPAPRHHPPATTITHPQEDSDMKTKTWIYSLLAVTALNSCGQLFDFEDNGTVDTATMTLDRHELTLMMGDSYVLRPKFVPDSVSNEEIYWSSDAEHIVKLRNDTLVALMPGRCTVTALSVQRRLTDQCVVNVQHRWAFNPVGYRYDMVVYARITVGGQPLGDRYMVAAFCGEELRGVAVHREQQGVGYEELRIYSNRPEGETISFRVYDRSTGIVGPLPGSMSFDGEAHGSLGNLVALGS